MAKRVKMKAWRGWCLVSDGGRAVSSAVARKEHTMMAVSKMPHERWVRVLVTEIPPKAKKRGAKR